MPIFAAGTRAEARRLASPRMMIDVRPMTESTENIGPGRATAPTGRQRLDGRLTLFGAATQPAVVEVTPRPRAKRMTRALATLGAAIVLAAIVALIPPHVPWLLGVLAVGAWRARAEWRGEYELHDFAGVCPRCEKPLALTERYITPPLVVHCDDCHSQPQLSFGEEVAQG